MSTPTLPSAPIGQLLAALTACACKKLRDIGRPVCDCCLLHSGNVFPADSCDCDCDEGAGRLAGRILQVSPAPSNNIAPTSNCMAGMAEVTLQLGVFRCYPVPEDGAPLSCEESTAEALALLADEQALRAAVACCEHLDKIPGRWETTPGQSNPHGPMGGCAGWVLSVTAYGQITFPKSLISEVNR